ncbi:MAG TPA: tetratricopeptide repeat protein [Noviherbaspirillum sp.]|uniref:LytR C-terminal domain-containing protein n=1 Tax=Noviherbaspirillum sp. TaxID=1926288 RepID=UPI002B463FF3|nr:tetratricopeptide repeat protein [Noviherbaspirillum sp.]HJV84035.1 tetratricopeptide repeat protein [Noviherbaspirillum sp.]
MKKILRLLPLASTIPLLLSCSTLNQADQKEKTALRIEPVFSIRNSGGNVQDYYQLGRYYQGQQRYELAIDAYRKALELNKDFVEAHNAIATSYAAQGEYDKAIAEFLSVLATAPQAAHIYNNLGYTYFLQKNYVSAVAAYDKALALDPKNARTSNNLAQAFAQLNEDEKSRVAAMRSPAPSAESAPSVTQPVPAVVIEEHAIPAAAATESTAAPAPAPVSAPASAIAAVPAAESAAAPVNLPAVAVNAPAAPVIAQAAPVESMPVETKPAPQAVQVMLAAAPPSHLEPAPLKPARLEIANGNGVNGMAKKTATFLAQEGVATAHLTNQKPYRQLETVIQYREGFREQAASLSHKFVNPPALAANAKLRGNADVRLVLGWDLRGSHKAVFVSDKPAATLAMESPRGPDVK